MRGLRLNSCINLGLNVVFAGLVTASLYCDFFQFKVSSIQDFKVGLTTLTHELPYEGLVVTAFTYFSSFREAACGAGNDDDYEEICRHIEHFQAGGLLFIVSSVVLLAMLAFNIVSLGMLTMLKSNWWTNRHWPHYASVGFFILYASAYILISSVDSLHTESAQLDENVKADYGIQLLFFSAGVGVVTLFHYILLRHVHSSSSIGSLLEPAGANQEASRPNQLTSDQIEAMHNEKLDAQRHLELKIGEIEALQKQLANLTANSRKTEHIADDNAMALKANMELRDKLKQKDLELERVNMDLDNYATRVQVLENEADDLRQQVASLQSQLRKYKRQGAGRDTEEVVIEVLSRGSAQNDDAYLDLQSKAEVVSLQTELKLMENYKQKFEDIQVVLQELSAKDQHSKATADTLTLKITRQREKIRLLKQQVREANQQTRDRFAVTTSEEYMRVVIEAHDKQIRDLKQLHEQDVDNLNADLDALREALATSKTALSKSIKEFDRLTDDISRLRERKADDDQDLKAARDQIHKLEDLLRSAKTQQSASESEVGRLNGELSAKKEQLNQSEAARSKALHDFSAQHGVELETYKQFYEDSLTRELERLRGTYQSTIDTLRADLDTNEASLKALSLELSETKQALQAALRENENSSHSLERLEKELEEVKHKFVHEETVSKDLQQQLRKLKASEETLRVELGLEKQKNSTLQDSFSTAMTDLEYRLNLSRETMKEKLVADHTKKLEDTTSLCDERLRTMQAELIQQRQDADQSSRERDRLNIDVTFLIQENGGLKEQYESMKVEFQETKADLLAQRSALESTIAELEDEILRLKADQEQLHSEASFRDDTGFLEGEIDRLKVLLDEREKMLSQKDDSESKQLILERDRKISELITKLNSYETEEKEWKQEAERNRIDLQLQISLLNEEKARLYIEKKRHEDDLQTKAEALARKKSKATTIKAQLLILQEQRDKQSEVLKADHNAELERQKRLYTESFTRDLEETKSLYLTRIERLQGDISILRDEVDTSADRLSKVLVEKANCEKRIAELQREQADIIEEVDRLREELRTLRQKTDIGDEERQRLYQLQEILKRQLLDKEVQLEANSNTIQARTASQEKMLKLLNEQLADLRNSLASKEKSLAAVMKERDDLRLELNARHTELGSMSIENQSLHKELLEVRRSTPTRASSNLMSVSSIPQSEDGYITAARSEYSIQSVEETVILESLAEIDVKRNPLVEKVARLKREPPMAYSNMWKLLETLMVEKTNVDKLELALGRQCRPMVDFAADFMYLQAGLQSLSLKQLKALICSLEELFNSNHPYATFFCRLLGLFHPRPFSQHLSIFLLLAQEQFAAVEKPSKNESFAKHYEVAQYGGRANLLDTMELIMRIFKNHRETGERIITLLTNQTDVEATLVKVCGTLARMGKDAEYIFDLLDLDNQGELDYHEFVDGIRFNLNIWVTEEEVEQLCEHIDSEATGMITRDEWGNKIDFQSLIDRAESDTFTTTKAALLNAIVDEYEQEMLKDYYKLRHFAPNSLLSQDQFYNLVEAIDPLQDERSIQRLYEQAMEKDRGHQGKISAEAFCTVILKNKVGGYGQGAFGLDGLSLDTPRESSRLTLSFTSPARLSRDN